MISGSITRESSVLAIVTHFNCNEWLADALSSMVNQTRSPDGIVVIDDSSLELPLEEVLRFPSVTLLHSHPNVGNFRLIQHLVETTDYDAYLLQDADDWSSDTRLETQLRYADETGAELVGSQWVAVFPDEGEAQPCTRPRDINAAVRENPTAYPSLHGTNLFSRRLFLQLGGYATGLRYGADEEFLGRAALAARAVNAPEHLYFYRVRRTSLTRSGQTGLDHPDRQRLIADLHRRSRDNVARLAAGDTPDLSPLAATAERPTFEHVCGPRLLGRADDGGDP